LIGEPHEVDGLKSLLGIAAVSPLRTKVSYAFVFVRRCV
jgi:hypothetical protein